MPALYPAIPEMRISEQPPTGKPRIKRAGNLSSDNNWLSFPKVPHLLQYVGSGVYYARVKLGGKLIRRSLGTTVWSDAKLRLVDFLKEQRQQYAERQAPTFSEARAAYERELDSNTSIKPQSKACRRWCIRKIELSRPELWKLRLDDVSPQACRNWAAALAE